MLATRLIHPRTLHLVQIRRLAAAASAPHSSVTSSSSSASTIPLSNVEAQWEKLTAEEQESVHQQLEEIQKKDWKTLSMDEKKAAYYVAFGPHGPRAAINPPGSGLKTFLGVVCALAVSGLAFYGIRAMAPPPPRTMTREWQEASNERAREQKLNPITGVSSENYKGSGFVTK